MSRRPRGLRAEVPALLAGSLLVFVALATFTLLSYRASVARFEAERRVEVLQLGTRLAGEIRRRDGLEALARALPSGAAVALLDARGRAVASFGHAGPADLLELPAGADRAPSVFGPGELAPDAFVALVPELAGAELRFLRFDLPARSLATERRRLAILSPAVVLLSIAAAALLLGVARALARPVDQLLERARAVGGEVPAGDEVDFLLATFDRALGALGAARPPDDLAELHAELGRQVESGLLLLDREGVLLAANPTAAELLGLAATAVGAPLARALGHHPELAERLGAAVATGSALPRGEAWLERGGERVALGLVAEPLRGEGGVPRGFLVLFADVTELARQQSQERLAESLAELGELAAGAAHELRNTAAALAGWLELARRRAPEGELGTALVEMDHELGRLRRVLEEFLLFARPGTRRAEAVDLVALVTRAASGPLVPEVGFDLRLPRGVAPVVGDPELLERAVRNLLANAGEAERAAGRAGPIEVVLRSDAAGHTLRIADRGPGLPPELAGRLFRPFVSGRADGAGLGLALCRRIVLLHGGEVRLENREGGGAVAESRLPAETSVTKGSEIRAESRPSRPPGSGPQPQF